MLDWVCLGHFMGKNGQTSWHFFFSFFFLGEIWNNSTSLGLKTSENATDSGEIDLNEWTKLIKKWTKIASSFHRNPGRDEFLHLIRWSDVRTCTCCKRLSLLARSVMFVQHFPSHHWFTSDRVAALRISPSVSCFLFYYLSLSVSSQRLSGLASFFFLISPHSGKFFLAVPSVSPHGGDVLWSGRGCKP